MSVELAVYRPRLAARRVIGTLFAAFCLLMLLLAVGVLGTLMVRVVMDGWSWLSVHFFTNYPSNLFPREKAGIKHALFGTLWLVAITTLVAVPLGVGAAVYLQEYARDTRFTRFIQLNIANLAGVPSIVYGILGLAVFVRSLHMGRSVIAGAMTMSLLILPVIIIAAREALAAVPGSIRSAAYALGATRWQVVRHHVLPAAMPGIMTGIILALSRAIGEAAPLIMLGALNYVPFVPTGLKSPFSALPIQIFDWASRPQPEFHHLAAAAIIVLLAVLLTMNAVAIGIRMYYQKDRL